jgi:hypothetical protein
MKGGMVSWETVLPFSSSPTTAMRDAMRYAVVAALLAHCLHTAWGVLGELGRVKLADCKNALTVVSVRDLVLCVVGYRIGSELVRAVVRARQSQELHVRDRRERRDSRRSGPRCPRPRR